MTPREIVERVLFITAIILLAVLFLNARTHYKNIAYIEVCDGVNQRVITNDMSESNLLPKFKDMCLNVEENYYDCSEEGINNAIQKER